MMRRTITSSFHLKTMGILFCGLFSSQNLSAKEVTPAEFWQLEQTPNAVIVDVRSPAEFKQGHLPSTMNIPFDQIAQLEAQVKEKIVQFYSIAVLANELVLPNNNLMP